MDIEVLIGALHPLA